tara:strand:- start:677 stop:1372 length:696 start_codon:yes stop_codon:yes gene_type:complete
MKTIAFIFARGGSKGLPDKNIKLFSGKPLIAHTISQAIKSDLFSDIVVSTDSEDIAKISKKYGANVPFIRPSKLANDTSSEWLSWKHAIKNYTEDIDCFVSLPCTSPLRNYETVRKMINYYKSNKFDVVLGIVKSNHSPSFNMAIKDDDNMIKIMNKSKNQINRRQDAEKCYRITTYAYITSVKYIDIADHLFNGSVGGYEVSKNESIDIDDDYDFDIASYMHSKSNEYKN